LIVVVAAVIEDGGAFLLTRRRPGTHLAGMWEFPGGKLQPLETHAIGLQREIREELDTDIDVGELVSYTVHAYADRTIAIYFYRCMLTGRPRPVLGQQMRWVIGCPGWTFSLGATSTEAMAPGAGAVRRV
jgi:mutator protein MutT